MAKKRILIADDDKQCLLYLRRLLEDSGYDVDDVSGGAEAIRRLTPTQYDLLMLDFDMKDIKGDRVSIMLSMDEQFKNLPIMIITAHVEKDEQVFKEYGATEVAYKPFNTEDFLSKVRRCLGED